MARPATEKADLRELDDLVMLLDPIVWAAHFAAALTCTVPVSRRDWNRYWRRTRREAQGYWHGATGRIAERLEIADSAWRAFVRLSSPEPAACLGDSSHDLSYLIQRRGITKESGGASRCHEEIPRKRSRFDVVGTIPGVVARLVTDAKPSHASVAFRCRTT